MDAVLHLAWSFSEDPLEVLEHDLRGHLYLLEEMASRKVRHMVYASTAVVYGKPRYSPIDEDHPLRVEEARKPLYGIAKAAAEKLCLMYGKTKGPPATVLRFWWAFGDDIGGKHLREMLRTAAAGDPLEVPADSGGSFLHMEDLAQGLDLCLRNPKAFGRTFNFSTVYVTWEEVAEMVRDATGSRSEIRCVPREEWTGGAFLADPWELSDAAARELLGYHPMDASDAKASLKGAIAACWEVMTEMTRGSAPQVCYIVDNQTSKRYWIGQRQNDGFGMKKNLQAVWKEAWECGISVGSGITFDAKFFSAVLSIVLIDLILSGDNAVVIALAVRTSERNSEYGAWSWGRGLAVLLRVVLTFFAAQLLLISFLKLIGGLLITWVAVKLFTEGRKRRRSRRPVTSGRRCGSSSSPT